MASLEDFNIFIDTSLYSQSIEFRLALFFQALAIHAFTHGDIDKAAYTRLETDVYPFLERMKSRCPDGSSLV